MTARLGNVVYWAGCAVAALLAVLAVVATWLGRGDLPDKIFIGGSILVCAVLAWLIGRAALYVLAGR